MLKALYIYFHIYIIGERVGPPNILDSNKMHVMFNYTYTLQVIPQNKHLANKISGLFCGIKYMIEEEPQQDGPNNHHPKSRQKQHNMTNHWWKHCGILYNNM